MTATRPSPDDAGPPRISYCLADGRGTVLAQRHADEPYYAASTIKLHVLLTALGQVDRGELDLEATLPAARTFTGHDRAPFTLEGDHLDPTHPAEGTPMTLQDLLVRMIDRSSNEATDTVLDLVGLDAVAEVLNRLGTTGTRIERLIGDPGALAQGLTNETTARDLVLTLRALASGDAVSRGSTALALAALRAQQIRPIADALSPGVAVGSKSGEVDGFRHDVAVIGDPTTPEARVLAIMTRGYSRPQADEAIAALVGALLPEVSA